MDLIYYFNNNEDEHGLIDQTSVFIHIGFLPLRCLKPRLLPREMITAIRL